MTHTTRNEAIEEFFRTLDIQGIDLPYFLDIEDVTDYASATEMLEDKNAFYVDVIYYHEAMEFLHENDNSLRQSLEIAEDMGYQIANINSELLASLLKSQKAREDWYDAEEEINEFFEELDELFPSEV